MLYPLVAWLHMTSGAAFGGTSWWGHRKSPCRVPKPMLPEVRDALQVTAPSLLVANKLVGSANRNLSVPMRLCLVDLDESRSTHHLAQILSFGAVYFRMKR